MYKKLMSLAALILLSSLVTTAGAKVHLAFDCGGCGPLQDGWIAITSCRTYTNVGGTDIDVAIAVGDGGECEENRYRC